MVPKALKRIIEQKGDLFTLRDEVRKNNYTYIIEETIISFKRIFILFSAYHEIHENLIIKEKIHMPSSKNLAIKMKRLEK